MQIRPLAATVSKLLLKTLALIDDANGCPILNTELFKVQVRDFRAMLFGHFPVKGEHFTRVDNPNRGLRVSSIKRSIYKLSPEN